MTLDTPHDAVPTPDDTTKLVEHFRQIAAAVMADAEIWLRQGALSRALPEAIPDAVLVVDEQGDIVLVNSQFELMFGYHRSEVIGQTPEMLMPEAFRAQHIEHRRRYQSNPRVRDIHQILNLVGRRKDGSEIRVLIKLGPAVVPNGVYTIVIIRRVGE